jgi:hypothetical protein
VLAERHAPDPVIDLRLFRDRVVTSAIASMVLSMLALFAVSFLLPFYFEELRGFSTAVGLALLARLNAASATWDIARRLGLAGIGQGLFQSPNTRALMDAAPARCQPLPVVPVSGPDGPVTGTRPASRRTQAEAGHWVQSGVAGRSGDDRPAFTGQVEKWGCPTDWTVVLPRAG